MRNSLALILALVLTGCANLFQPVQDPRASYSAPQLYQDAKEDLDDGNYERAIKSFEMLESRFPYGQYAAHAQLEIAYAYYKDNDAASAIMAADRFIKLHPNHANVDYAYYLKGVANFIGETGIISSLFHKDMSERDPKTAIESFDAFKELVSRFPDSKYAPDSLARMRYLANTLALHEVHVADYYYRRGAYVAAVGRAQGAIRDFPKTPAVEDALVIMAKSYNAMGMDKLRDDTDRVLKLSFPANAVNTSSAEPKPWWKFWN